MKNIGKCVINRKEILHKNISMEGFHVCWRERDNSNEVSVEFKIWKWRLKSSNLCSCGLKIGKVENILRMAFTWTDLKPFNETWLKSNFFSVIRPIFCFQLNAMKFFFSISIRSKVKFVFAVGAIEKERV